MVRKVVTTNAAVSGSVMFEALPDQNNNNRDFYADCGYPSAERKATLTAAGWRVKIRRKGSAN